MWQTVGGISNTITEGSSLSMSRMNKAIARLISPSIIMTPPFPPRAYIHLYTKSTLFIDFISKTSIILPVNARTPRAIIFTKINTIAYV